MASKVFVVACVLLTLSIAKCRPKINKASPSYVHNSNKHSSEEDSNPLDNGSLQIQASGASHQNAMAYQSRQSSGRNGDQSQEVYNFRRQMPRNQYQNQNNPGASYHNQEQVIHHKKEHQDQRYEFSPDQQQFGTEVQWQNQLNSQGFAAGAGEEISYNQNQQSSEGGFFPSQSGSQGYYQRQSGRPVRQDANSNENSSSSSSSSEEQNQGKKWQQGEDNSSSQEHQQRKQQQQQDSNESLGIRKATKVVVQHFDQGLQGRSVVNEQRNRGPIFSSAETSQEQLGSRRNAINLQPC